MFLLFAEGFSLSLCPNDFCFLPHGNSFFHNAIPPSWFCDPVLLSCYAGCLPLSQSEAIPPILLLTHGHGSSRSPFCCTAVSSSPWCSSHHPKNMLSFLPAEKWILFILFHSPGDISVLYSFIQQKSEEVTMLAVSDLCPPIFFWPTLGRFHGHHLC